MPLFVCAQESEAGLCVTDTRDFKGRQVSHASLCVVRAAEVAVSRKPCLVPCNGIVIDVYNAVVLLVIARSSSGNLASRVTGP